MRNENDIRNPKKKYNAQEVDAILTATVKNSGFQPIKSYKHPVTNDIAFTSYTNGSRFIAVFTTANDSTPKKNQNGVIIDKNVTGSFTLDELLKLYKTLISKDVEKGNKDFELIIPLCLCPKDLDDPKHLVYLKIHKTDNQMHALILDSTGVAHYSVENISEALRVNFPNAIIDHPISFNEEHVSSQGINDGPFTIENIRADLQDNEIIEDSHSAKTAKQLREAQYENAKSSLDNMQLEEQKRLEQARLDEIERVHTLSTATNPNQSNLNIVSDSDIPRELKSRQSAQGVDEEELQRAIQQIQSLPELNESQSKRHSSTDLSKKPIMGIGQHRISSQTSNVDTKTQTAYFSQLKVMKNMLGALDKNEKNNVAYTITIDIIDPKKRIPSTMEKTIKIPPVIAAILDKIKSANTANAEQVIKEIRNIANSDATDTKINRWKSSKETKQICARLVEMIDKYSSPQARPPSSEHKA